MRKVRESCVISKLYVPKFLEVKLLQNTLFGRLSRRRYSCTGGRPWVRCKSGVSQVATGVVLGEPGFAKENEEGETALGLDGEKVFSPAENDP